MFTYMVRELLGAAVCCDDWFREDDVTRTLAPMRVIMIVLVYIPITDPRVGIPGPQPLNI